jgi:hypothetical protein
VKVVINACYGGFGLSDAAYEALIGRGWTVTTYGADGHVIDKEAGLVRHEDESWLHMTGTHYSLVGSRSNNNLRSNPDLVAVVEELKADANGMHAKLRVVEIPFDSADGWEINEYDGYESVHEYHRTWG